MTCRHFDVVVIGAGAARLMCAITAGRRGRRVLVLDHANKVGKKILMSGGGRCNFTNRYCTPENFISANPHFAKSALSRYTPEDFVALVERHGVPYHEKKLGQLFCDRSSKDIVRILLAECDAAGVIVRTHSPVKITGVGSPHVLETLRIDLFPDFDITAHVREMSLKRPKLELQSLLARLLPRRVAQRWCELWLENKPLERVGDDDLRRIEAACKPWIVRPAGTEGYRTAEVTAGGVSTDALSSKTMECRGHPGLYFIGEVVDVTGHLGGHNFQWAWASGFAAGNYA